MRPADDADLPLSRLFERWPAAAAVFMDRRLACVGCPIARFHTVADACRDHGLDEAAAAELRARLRVVARPPVPLRRRPRGPPGGGAR